MDRGPVTSLATRVALSTPPGRDRVVDAVRVASLLVVVVGHWLMADIAIVDGQVRASNVLSALPLLHPVTWILQVIPLFFIAGGFANLTVWRRVRRDGGSYVDYLEGRVVRLLRPVVVFALLAESLLGLAWLAGLDAQDVGSVAQLLGRPLWFLAVYLLVTALAPAMAVWHARAPVAALLAPMAGATAIDVVRLTYDVRGPGYLNFVLVWLVAQQLGFWYADRRSQTTAGPAYAASRRSLASAGHASTRGHSVISRRVLRWSVVLVVAILSALTVYGPYPASMIGLPGEMSNMNPPSVCLMLLAVGQVAAVMLARQRLARWLERPAVWAGVVMLGARAMTIYVWHLMALIVVVGAVLLLGVGLPAGGSAWWWVSRPLWLATLGVVLLAVVLPVSRLERDRTPGAPGPTEPAERSGFPLASGVALALTGLFGYAVVGLEPFGSVGSRLLGLHASVLPSSLCLLTGWLLVVMRRRADER